MGISNEAIRRLESKYKGISNDTIRRIENMAAGYTPPMAESTQEVQTPAMQTEQVPNIQRVSVPRKFVSMYKANQMPTTAGEMAGGAVQGANLSKTGMPITDKWNLPQNKFVSVYRNGGDTSGRTGMTIGDELQNGRENILRNMQNGSRAMTEEERAAAIQDFTNASQGLNSWDNTIQGNINARQNYLKAAKESEQVRKTLPKATRNATLKDLTLNSFKRGYMQSVYGQESYKSMMGLPNSKKYYEDLLKESEYNFAPNTWYKDAISGAMEQLGQQARQWTDPRSVATGTAAASAAFIAGQAGPQVALPEEVITVPGAFAVGINAGSTLSNFEIEAGLAYNEMIENGVSEETARNIATGIGAGNAALEFVQADDLLKSAKILNRIDSKNPVTKKLLLYLKDRGVHVATESAQEMAQETVTAVGSNIGSKIDKGEWEYSKGDVAKRVGQTGASSALTFGALGLGTDAVNFGTRKLMSGADRQTADNVADVKNGANENTVSADNQPIQNELNRRKFRSVYADNNANDAAMIKSVQNEGTQEKTQEEINRMSDDEFMDYMSSRRQQSDNVRKNMVGRQKIGIGDEVDWTYGNDFKGTGYVKDYVNDGDMSYYVIEDDNGQLLNLNDENDIVTITPKRQVGAATSGKTVDIDERSYAEFSDRKVKAYQYEYPAVKRFYKEKAAEIAQDVRDTIKGERIAINDPTSSSLKYIGVNRVTSDMVARIKDTSGASYADITSACERIINDRGTENIKLCKLIEGVIDDALTDGYTDFRGQKIEPNSEYIELKNIIQQGGQRQALNVQNEQSVQPNEGERIKFRSKIVQEQNTQAYNSLSDGQKQAYEKLKQSDGNVGSVVNAVSDRQKYAVSLAKRLGYDVVFFDGGKTNSRGATVDGVIFINDRQDALEHITGHEVMHNVISDENVKADFLNTVKSYVESSNEFKAVFEKKRQMYEDRLGKEVSDDYIWEEVAADIGGDLFGDSEFITKVTREQPSLAKRIVESIRELINKLRNSLAQRTNGFIHPNNRIIEGETLRYVTDLEKLEKAYVKAIRENTAVNDNNGEIKYSPIEYDKNNTPYVVINENILKNVPQSDWAKTIKNNLAEKFKDGIKVGNKTIYVNRQSSKEMVYSKNTQYYKQHNKTMYADKLNAVNNTDEVLKASRDYVNEDLKHERKDNIKDFSRGKVLLKIGNNEYEAEVVVGNQSDNTLIMYDIIGLKPTKIERLSKTVLANKPQNSRSINLPIDNSISDDGENVNTQNKENFKFSVDDKENEIYSENFKRWFGDWENNPKKASKVVNADGTPKIMYHGSGADFTVFDKKKAKYSGTFGRGFYFTDSKSHAGTYGKLYEVYLDVKNPVDDKTKVTNQQLRNFLEAVAEDEDYSIENYGTYDIDEIIPKINQDSLFTVLRDVSSTAIGDMVEATELFNKVNGTNYDGIFSDTEYVVFKPNQIKSATDNIGTFDKGNDDIRFSLSKPVEETKDLIAVHNLTADKLKGILELGGFPVPSIAVTKAEYGHDNFGEITVVFGRDSIDPANKDNKAYSADIYSPRFPQIDYKLNEDAMRDISKRLGMSISQLEANAFSQSTKDNVAGSLKRDPNVRETFIKEANISVKPVLHMPEMSRSIYKKDAPTEFLAKEGLTFDDIVNDSSVRGEFIEAVQKGISMKSMADKWAVRLNEIFDECKSDENTYKAEKVKFDNDVKIAKGTAEPVENAYSYQDGVNNAIRENEEAFEMWIDELIEPAFEKKYIRRNIDPFKNNGESRSFEEMHTEYNLDNVVKAIKGNVVGGENTSASVGNIRAYTSKAFDSIDDIKSSSGRLLSSSEMEKIKRSYEDRYYEFFDRLAEYGDTYSIEEGFIEAAKSGKYSPAAVAITFRRSGLEKVDKELATEISDFLNELRNAPTEYFEIKPQRAVGFDEIKAVIVPDNIDTHLKQELENRNINVMEYESGSLQSRTDMLNSLDDVKFSIDENTEEKPKQKVSKFRTNTLERAKMTEESPHGLFGTNETEEMNEGFEYKVRGKRTYESEAKAYLENDYDGEAASIRESNILTDTQVAEAQIIADDLYKKYLNSGKSADLREFTDWTKVIAQKTREAARALKATDTVWEKNKAVKTVMEAEKAVNEVEELKGKTKVIDQKTKQVTDKLKDIEDIGIDELIGLIDKMKLTPDLLMEYINAKPKKGSAETDQTGSGKRQADGGNNGQRNEDIDAAAAELTNRIKNRVDSDGKPIKEKLPDNMLYRMVNDLFGIAKETIKTDRPKFDNTYKDIKEAVENRGEYKKVWRETKDAIKEMYKDNPKALELLEDYFERGVRPPVPLSVADSGINKALRELNINLKDVVKEYYTSGESTKTALVEYIKEQTGLSGENAQAISRMIENRYRQLVKAEKEKYLKGLFSSRPKLQKDFRYVTNKITEILNADGYRNQTYIDRINEKINPLIAEAIRQKKINLAEVVKNGYKATNWEQLKFIQSLKEQLDGRVSEDDLFQFWETAQSEFARLAQVKRDSILKQKFAQKEVGEKATQLEKILELINLGAYDTKSVVRDMIKEKSGLPTLGKADTEYIIANVEMAERFAEGSRERDVYMAYAMKRIQEKIPSDLSDKILSLQRIAMLLNPKTMIRNVVGNAIMQPVYTMQDTLFGAGIDKLISKKTNMRTTSVSNVKEQGKGFAKGLTESVDDFRKGVNTRKSENGKYELGNKLVWKDKGWQKIFNKPERFMSFLLDAGDRPFYEAFYNDSIEQQKRANKTDVVTEEMKQIARDTALQRTWQDTNETTKAAQSLRKGINKLFGGSDKFGLGNIVMPFVQTPANLTKALVKYSPVGLTKSLTYDAYKFNKAVKNGTADFAMQKRFVDKVSAGLAGTLIYLLSFALTKLGAVNGGGDDDYDKARFEKSIKGIQPYSIKVGNQTYTFDWAQPVGGLMAAAADVASGTFNHESAADIILKAFEAGGNTMFDQSFLTGVKDLFGEDTFVEGLENIALEMPKQWLTPTALKQLADVMDDTARNTYDPSEMKKKLNEMQTRIPFKSRKLEPRLNVFGEEQERISGGNNIFNVFANPAYVSGIKTSQITEEVDRLNKATGNTDIYPSAAPKTVDSQKLTAREYTEYQRKLGTKTKTLYNDIIADKDLESVFGEVLAFEKSVRWSEMNPEQRTKALNSIKSTYKNEPKKIPQAIRDLKNDTSSVTVKVDIKGKYSDYSDEDKIKILKKAQSTANDYAKSELKKYQAENPVFRAKEG